MLAMVWKAETKKKPLFMLSTGSCAAPVTIHTRRDPVDKPTVVNTYNHSMNGVDVAEQLTVFYLFVRKTRKWWRKVFFWLIEASVVNSYPLVQGIRGQAQ